MTIAESLYFTYDNIDSRSMGLINVNMKSGMQEETFTPEAEILEYSARNNQRPYFMGVRRSPLVLNLTFAFEKTWDDEKLREIARWLGNQNYYKPLYFSDNPSKIYYAMCVGESKLIHNTLKQGFIEIQMRCNAPWAYAPALSSGIHDFSTNPTGADFVFENYGDLITKPIIQVELVSGTSFSIVNNSNGGKKLAFTGLAAGEVINIDCDYETIESSLPNTYRYGNLSDDSVFLGFDRGMSYLKIYGNVRIRFIQQDRLLA